MKAGARVGACAIALSAALGGCARSHIRTEPAPRDAAQDAGYACRLERSEPVVLVLEEPYDMRPIARMAVYEDRLYVSSGRQLWRIDVASRRVVARARSDSPVSVSFTAPVASSERLLLPWLTCAGGMFCTPSYHVEAFAPDLSPLGGSRRLGRFSRIASPPQAASVDGGLLMQVRMLPGQRLFVLDPDGAPRIEGEPTVEPGEVEPIRGVVRYPVDGAVAGMALAAYDGGALVVYGPGCAGRQLLDPLGAARSPLYPWDGCPPGRVVYSSVATRAIVVASDGRAAVSFVGSDGRGPSSIAILAPGVERELGWVEVSGRPAAAWSGDHLLVFDVREDTTLVTAYDPSFRERAQLELSDLVLRDVIGTGEGAVILVCRGESCEEPIHELHLSWLEVRCP